MRAELVNLNRCVVPFLCRAAVNLSWYDSNLNLNYIISSEIMYYRYLYVLILLPWFFFKQMVKHNESKASRNGQKTAFLGIKFKKTKERNLYTKTKRLKMIELEGAKQSKYAYSTHEGQERHVLCLARHYFANARKMLWSCEG